MKRLLLLALISTGLLAQSSITARVIIDNPPATIPSYNEYFPSTWLSIYLPPPTAASPVTKFAIEWTYKFSDGTEMKNDMIFDSTKGRWQKTATNLPLNKSITSVVITASAVGEPQTVTVTVLP